MKIRSGFVSNSSSSSFICAVPYNRKMGEDRVNIDTFKDGLSDGLKHNDVDDINYYMKLIEEYEKISKEYNLYIFDLRVDYGDEGIVDQLKKIPGFTVLKVLD